jgi:hypothetical protein
MARLVRLSMRSDHKHKTEPHFAPADKPKRPRRFGNTLFLVRSQAFPAQLRHSPSLWSQCSTATAALAHFTALRNFVKLYRPSRPIVLGMAIQSVRI